MTWVNLLSILYTMPKATRTAVKTASKSQSAAAPSVVARSRKKLSLKLPKLNFSLLKKIPMPKSYTPVLVVLLIVASFLLGMLVTKVQYLESGAVTGTPSQAQAGAQQQQPANAAQPGAKVDVTAGNLPAQGDPNAKVKVVEFADFQCPFCEQWFTTVEASLIKDYVKTGKVTFSFRDYAFLGQESTYAAEAARCANDQGKYWDFHDYLYSHQGQENSGAFAKDKLEGFAATMGLDTTTFNSCLESDKYAQAVKDDTTAGQKASVNGTPTVYVNGIQLVGAQPYSALQTLIDQELAKK